MATHLVVRFSVTLVAFVIFMALLYEHFTLVVLVLAACGVIAIMTVTLNNRRAGGRWWRLSRANNRLANRARTLGAASALLGGGLLAYGKDETQASIVAIGFIIGTVCLMIMMAFPRGLPRR